MNIHSKVWLYSMFVYGLGFFAAILFKDGFGYWRFALPVAAGVASAIVSKRLAVTDRGFL